ncbi:MAG TPA: ATP-dependent Clp protease adaptor ClpS [Lentimicrobium sp.]|jgi:ATP-dependent Clp protease adaptor protein ClpS|nr:ATP-dependent Clp protease adaptor ClpS [Lentimicrobium sp.]
MVKERQQTLRKDKESVAGINELVLYNDDFNTFEFVIETLIDVCGLEPLQAEQITLIVHYKGKCGVKSGGYTELNPMCNEMTNRGLTVSIE